MLVLSRRTGEGIIIGDSIRIVVVRNREGKVRLGIEAPRDTPVLREELATGVPAGQPLNTDGAA